MKSKKLGIMGGTFDPVHLGHLQTAKFIYEHLGLEKIIFVPAFIAPHKVGLEFAPAADRYRMTELATEPFPYFEVTDIELPTNIGKRLEALGMTCGTPVTVLNSKNHGVLIVKVRGTRFALGRNITKKVLVG